MDERSEMDLDLELLAKIVVGIGEVSEIAEVPQRQIRYWEEKGYIKSLNTRGSIRRYDYYTIKKILLIKELIDEGYTLERAVEKVEDRLQLINKAFCKLKTVQPKNKSTEH